MCEARIFDFLLPFDWWQQNLHPFQLPNVVHLNSFYKLTVILSTLLQCLLVALTLFSTVK